MHSLPHPQKSSVVLRNSVLERDGYWQDDSRPQIVASLHMGLESSKLQAGQWLQRLYQTLDHARQDGGQTAGPVMRRQRVQKAPWQLGPVCARVLVVRYLRASPAGSLSCLTLRGSASVFSLVHELYCPPC